VAERGAVAAAKALIRLRLAKRAFWERATGSQTVCTPSRTPVACPKGAADEIKSRDKRRFRFDDLDGSIMRNLKLRKIQAELFKVSMMRN